MRKQKKTATSAQIYNDAGGQKRGAAAIKWAIKWSTVNMWTLRGVWGMEGGVAVGGK